MNGQKVRSVDMLVCVFSSHIKLQGRGRPGIGRELDFIMIAYAKREARACRVYIRGYKGAMSRKFDFLFFIIKLHGGSVVGVIP